MKEDEINEVKGEDSDKEDKKSTVYFLIAVILIVAAVAGIFALKNYYVPEKDKDIVKYNNFNFVKEESLWLTQVQVKGQLYNVRLHYNPYEVENIPYVGDIDERFQQDAIYITHDPAEGNLGHVAVAAAELSLSMASVFNIEPVAACSKNFTGICETRPIITCENTNSSVIYLKEDDITQVSLKGNCIVIQGRGQELIKAADKVLYIWYRVIK